MENKQNLLEKKKYYCKSSLYILLFFVVLTYLFWDIIYIFLLSSALIIFLFIFILFLSSWFKLEEFKKSIKQLWFKKTTFLIFFYKIIKLTPIKNCFDYYILSNKDDWLKSFFKKINWFIEKLEKLEQDRLLENQKEIEKTKKNKKEWKWRKYC